MSKLEDLIKNLCPNGVKQNKLGEINGYIEEMYSGQSVVKVYNATNEVMSDFDKINDSLFECSINKPHEEQRAILYNKDNYIGKYAHVEFRARSGVNSLPFHARIIYIDN